MREPRLDDLIVHDRHDDEWCRMADTLVKTGERPPWWPLLAVSISVGHYRLALALNLSKQTGEPR